VTKKSSLSKHGLINRHIFVFRRNFFLKKFTNCSLRLRLVLVVL